MRKINLLLLFFVIFILSASAQIDESIISDNQKAIYKATEKVLYIIRQDYRFQGKQAEYNRKGKDYFGRYYTLAIMSNNKLWCNVDIRKPWANDADYAQYKNIDSLKPVLSNVAIRQVSQKDFVNVKMEICPQKLQDSLYKNIPVTFYTLKDKNTGISNEIKTSNTNGWLLLAYTQANIVEKDTCKIIWSIYQPKPAFINGGLLGKINKPPFSNNVLGGVYLSVNFTPGNMQLTLSGIFDEKLVNYYITGIPYDPLANVVTVAPVTQKTCCQKWKEKRQKNKESKAKNK